MFRRRYTFFSSALAAVVLAGMLGCGASDFGVVPVTGTVKYSDGSIPKGADIATVTFQPVTNSQEGKGATGDIMEDGTFKLTTIEPHDGAMPGEYIVTVTIMVGYPDGKFAVADEYRDVATSPLKATIKPSGANHFDFTIEQP